MLCDRMVTWKRWRKGHLELFGPDSSGNETSTQWRCPGLWLATAWTSSRMQTLPCPCMLQQAAVWWEVTRGVGQGAVLPALPALPWHRQALARCNPLQFRISVTTFFTLFVQRVSSRWLQDLRRFRIRKGKYKLVIRAWNNKQETSICRHFTLQIISLLLSKQLKKAGFIIHVILNTNETAN